MNRAGGNREPFVDREAVVAAVRVLADPDQVIEVRALDAVVGSGRPLTYSGYFNDPCKLAEAIASIRSASGIYTTMNSIEPTLIARCFNKIKVAGKNATTSDHCVVRRRWLLVDGDPERVTGIASSDVEHEISLAFVGRIRDWLTEQGWPDPVLADSGNGGHALYCIDLPPDDGGLIERCLKALSRRWDTDEVQIDKTVFNPARIVRLYGCLNGKGDPDAAALGRPQRRAKLLNVPDDIQVVPREKLEALAAMYDQQELTEASEPATSSGEFDIESWIREHGLATDGPLPWSNGGRCWELETCPWNPDHVGSAYIVQLPDGKIGAGCHHNSCSDKDWHALRDVVEPGWREQKKAKKKRVSKRSAGGGIIKRLADRICRADHFAQDAGTKLYRYSKGAYRLRGEEFVRRRVKRLMIEWKLTELWSPTLADSVVEYVRVDAPQLWEMPPLDVVNVQNGLLNVETRELLPHTSEHLSSVQLPVTFDPAATCPAIEQFASEVFPADAIGLAWEIPALLMTPNTSIQQAVLLHGLGGNGKSTYLAMLRAFLGRQNTTAISLHKLESDRFSVARLYGKLANICPDLPSEHLAGTSMFKAITGGDEVTGEFKFKDSFEFICFVRLIFSANHLPRSQDASQGFFERWIVIPFDRSFRGMNCEIPREVLDARLAAPAELSGLLNKALDALPRIRRQNSFTRSESVERAWSEFRAITDPLAIWLDRSTIESPKALVVRHRLRNAFNQHLETLGRPAMTDKAFALEFAKLRPQVTSGQRTVSGKLQWCYVGIGLISEQRTDSHGSQGSQGSPYINQSHARGSEVEGWRDDRDAEVKTRTSEGNPVNPVNPVMCSSAEAGPPDAVVEPPSMDAASSCPTASCGHLHTQPDQWVHRDSKAYCPTCSKFMGNLRSGE